MTWSTSQAGEPPTTAAAHRDCRAGLARGLLASGKRSFLPVLSLVIASDAFAAPGDHIRAGDVEVVPSVDFGLHYQTNVYRSEVLSTPAANLGITPAVAVSASGDDHQFSASGEWRLQKYLFVGELESSTLDTSERIANLDRFNNFQLGLGADLFKRNQIGLRLSDNMTMNNWQVEAPTANVPYTSQYHNAFKAGLRANPGPALEIVPGFTWTYDNYQTPDFTEEDAEGERALNSKNSYGPRLDAKWAFLPRTALVAHLAYEHNQWANNTIASPGSSLGDQVDVPNSDFVRFTTGIDGRFTERLFMQALVGYGVGLFNVDSVEAPEDLENISANVSGLNGFLVKTQVKYQITPRTDEAPGSAVTVGYVKDFRTAFYTNFIAVNQIFAEFGGEFSVVEPSLRYEIQFQDYGGEVDRNDIVNRVIGGIAWNATDFSQLAGGLTWMQRASSEDQVEFDNLGLQFNARFQY